MLSTGAVVAVGVGVTSAVGVGVASEVGVGVTTGVEVGATGAVKVRTRIIENIPRARKLGWLVLFVSCPSQQNITYVILLSFQEQTINLQG